MNKIDEYSYRCGIMDCFNEMVKAGFKRIALAHPFKSKEERDEYLEFVKQITTKYHTHYYLDDDPLLTDLFALHLNKDTYNIIFYKDPKDIEEYCYLKELKKQAFQDGNYNNLRHGIAYRFGKLLSYPDDAIEEYIASNNEKE